MSAVGEGFCQEGGSVISGVIVAGSGIDSVAVSIGGSSVMVGVGSSVKVGGGSSVKVGGGGSIVSVGNKVNVAVQV